MLSVTYAECHLCCVSLISLYAESCYAECRYAVCRGATKSCRSYSIKLLIYDKLTLLSNTLDCLFMASFSAMSGT